MAISKPCEDALPPLLDPDKEQERLESIRARQQQDLKLQQKEKEFRKFIKSLS